MLVQITEKSKAAFEAAAKKLNISAEMPPLGMLREDLALYITATYMLAVIIEAEKNGNLHDITNHDIRKYEPWFTADDGYKPGSSGGGFSYRDYDFAPVYSLVGARLSSNSREECETNAEAYADLWEIFILNVR